MTPITFSADFARVADLVVWLTNPVLCIDRMLDRWSESNTAWVLASGGLPDLLATLAARGIFVPAAAVGSWRARGFLPPDFRAPAAPPAPRVVGLAVDEAEVGYVYPLRPVPVGPHWQIDPTLPFTAADLQAGLAGLLRGAGVSDAVPERLAFAVDNPTDLPAGGDSMTVAGLLAILDGLGGRVAPLFRAAVALVSIGQDGRLEAVENIPTKLAAAHRECGPLSLVVCLRGDSVPRDGVGEVWEVDSLDALAGKLHTAGLLAPLLAARGPLNGPEAWRVVERLRALIAPPHQYREAAELGDRVRGCGFTDPPDAAAWVEFARLHASACRHHGRFGDAVIVGHETHARVIGLGVGGCDDEEADAAAEYAASLFSGHRFRDIPRLLRPWAAAAAADPRRFRPLTRVKVWNTLARALAVLGEDGWDDLFGRSLELHQRLADTESITRTQHYRIHALLRHRDASRARTMLHDADAPTGEPWSAFMRATLARVEGRAWADATLEAALAVGKKPYSAWLYAQAAARQAPRPRDDAVGRFGLAIQLLHHEAEGVKGNVCNLFAAILQLAAAARTDDGAGWGAARERAGRFLNESTDHRDYYRDVFLALPEVPDVPAAERLVERVPYF